jgi:ABC-type transport system substrate-binding protein
MDAADIEVDPAKRADLYQQAQLLIVSDAAEIMRSNTKNTFLINSAVKGLDFTPQDSDLPGLITGLLNVTIER